MSEADRVFARMTTPGPHLEVEAKQLLHIAPRRRGAHAGQSRVVEVVHRRSRGTAPAAEPASPPAYAAHAATWPDGFHARPALSPLPADDTAMVTDAAQQVGHVMPGWEPLLAPLSPDEPAAKATAVPKRQPKVAKLGRSADQSPAVRRVFADPFTAGDTGANCVRCGYLVSPARAERGLRTCRQCG